MNKRRSQIRWGTALFLYFSLVTVPSAHAYIDPASGSFLFQITIGALLGAGLAIKMFWRRIWGFLTGKTRRERAQAEVGGQVPAEARTDARAEATADPQA